MKLFYLSSKILVLLKYNFKDQTRITNWILLMENVKFLNYVGQMIFLSVANTNLLIAFQECQILISIDTF